MGRYTENYEGSYFNFVGGGGVAPPDTLVILCHGFNGKDAAEYWGNLPFLFSADAEFMTTDILYFGYPSSATLLPNPLACLGIAQPLGDMQMVIQNLANTALYYAGTKSYRAVRFVGHSLGGHVVLNAATMVRDQLPLGGVLCLSVPNRPLFIARLHNVLSLGRHPQIRYLSSRHELTNNLINVATALRQATSTTPAVNVSLVHSYNDPLVGLTPMAVYDQVVTLRGPHMWFREIRQATDPHYQRITKWMRNGVL